MIRSAKRRFCSGRRWKTNRPHAPSHGHDVIILRCRVDDIDLRISILSLSSAKKGAVGESAERKSFVTKAGPHGFRIKDRANSGGSESTSAAGELFSAESGKQTSVTINISRYYQEVLATGFVPKAIAQSKVHLRVGQDRTITCSRAHERFA